MGKLVPFPRARARFPFERFAVATEVAARKFFDKRARGEIKTGRLQGVWAGMFGAVCWLAFENRQASCTPEIALQRIKSIADEIYRQYMKKQAEKLN